MGTDETLSQQQIRFHSVTILYLNQLVGL